MIHASLHHYLSLFAIAGDKNQGNLWSKTLSLQVAIQLDLENSTQPNLCSSFNEGLGFYYLNTVLPMSEISVSQIISFQSFSPNVKCSQNISHSAAFLFLFWNRLDIFQDYQQDMEDPNSFPFCISKGHYWSKHESDWKTSNPETSVTGLCDTDLLDEVFNSKGVPWQHK